MRKEHQENLHKAQLLSWIGHGNFVNSRLNDINLMKCALTLLPKNKNQCYPKEKTDIEYFKQITTYYKQEMKLRNAEMYCTRLKNRPPLKMSLALQMNFKSAICLRDYVLIFATLLRSIGIQCRVVQSIVCDPKICPKTELLSLSKKTNEATVTKSKTSSRASKKKKPVKIPQLDGGDNDSNIYDSNDVPKRSKTRSTKNKAATKTNSSKKLSSTTHMETLSPKVKVTVDSRNRITKANASDNLKSEGGNISETAKKSRALEMTKKTLNIFSPRKTRSTSRDQSPKPSTSSEFSKITSEVGGKKKAPVEKDTKDMLKIVLPKTRSRSRSSEVKIDKPNLQKLCTKRKAENESEKSSNPKMPKLAEKPSNNLSSSRKRSNLKKENKVERKKARISESSEEDGSLKYFKLNKSKKSASKSTVNETRAIDPRVLSSEGEEESIDASPKKSKKGIDIWIEAYSEKEEKWIAIDVHRGKLDCVVDITKKATQPIVYVFAWNNDNSIKDVSSRYCKNLNTRIRKMRVNPEYLNSVLHHFSGVRTSRDFKEDDELNKLQLQEGMPKSIAE